MDLAFELPNNLSPEFCQELITKFEADQRKQPGHTGSGHNPQMKMSIDLMFSRHPEWNEISKILDEKLLQGMAEYDKFLKMKLPNGYSIGDTWHSGYQLQKSGYYRWHNDERIEHGRQRIVTFIWYLNTIEQGGHTGFLYKSVKPEVGKLVIFPSSWDYVHCGFDAKDKYIVTGWLWRDVMYT
jgi:hypothetical protein